MNHKARPQSVSIYNINLDFDQAHVSDYVGELQS